MVESPEEVSLGPTVAAVVVLPVDDDAARLQGVVAEAPLDDQKTFHTTSCTAIAQQHSTASSNHRQH